MQISASVAEAVVLFTEPRDREAAVVDFLEVSLDALRINRNEADAKAHEIKTQKRLRKAARTFGTSEQEVERCLSAFARLLLECARHRPSRAQYLTAAESLPFSGETNEAIFGFYQEHYEALQHALDVQDAGTVTSGVSGVLPWYRDASWRLDIQVSSRRAANDICPSFLLRIDTSDDKSHDLQASAASLRYLHEELSDALAQLDSVHVKRVDKYL